MLCALVMFTAASEASAVPEVTINTKTVSSYKPIELVVNGEFGAKNPYDYSEINVKGYFTGPLGKTFEADGFFMEDRIYNEASNDFSPGASAFKIRYTPHIRGKWKYRVKAFKAGKEIFSSKEGSFECVYDSSAKGFVRVSGADPLYLEFDNGDSFYPVGLNMGWADHSKNVMAQYEEWMENFKANGGNFIRVWMCPWGFGIEWEEGIMKYGARQDRAALLDMLFEKAAQKGMYIMLCFTPHGEYSEKTNPEWERSPHNTKNGGYLSSPDKFFTDKRAKDAHKNKLRYIAARWGYSANLAAWELFNEVDLTDNFDALKVTQWHAEMLSLLEKHDPYRHLKTTSFSNPDNGDSIWKLPNIDFTQTHIYNVKSCEVIYNVSREKTAVYQKPHIIGEYGIDSSDAFIERGDDKEGENIHQIIWAGGLSLSMGTPMSWWWDSYIPRNNLYKRYEAFTGFIKGIDFARGNFTELSDYRAYYADGTDKKAGDVTLYPSNEWAKPKKNRFLVNAEGEISGAKDLNAFIMGSGHPDMKNNPVIVTRNVRPGKLIIRTSAVSHKNTLVVTINGKEELREEINAESIAGAVLKPEWKIYQADFVKEYEVELGQGENEIYIDNEGEDWIKIESYRITGYLDPSRAPLFIAGIQGTRSAYIYVKNRGFNFDGKDAGEIKDTYLNLTGLRPGRFTVTYYDTRSAQVISKRDEITESGDLTLNLPPVKKDIAVKVRGFRPGEND